MCELCSTDPEEVRIAKKSASLIAEKLEEAASIYRGLSNGAIKPHTEEFMQRTYIFKNIIRYLVKEYV